jgi:hypothetical protein
MMFTPLIRRASAWLLAVLFANLSLFAQTAGPAPLPSRPPWPFIKDPALIEETTIEFQEVFQSENVKYVVKKTTGEFVFYLYVSSLTNHDIIWSLDPMESLPGDQIRCNFIKTGSREASDCLQIALKTALQLDKAIKDGKKVESELNALHGLMLILNRKPPQWPFKETYGLPKPFFELRPAG